MDVSAVRAEIKAWERNFTQQHGRKPTTEEIRGVPDIADKYRLYNKLSKRSQPTQADRPNTPPRDPSRPSTSTASLLLSTSKSKPRAVKVDALASTSNPFSPVKNRRAKQRETSPDADGPPIASLLLSASRANPFKTPTKPSNRPREPRRAPVPPIQEQDEDPFPLIVQPSQAKTIQPPSPPNPNHEPPLPSSSIFTDTTEHPPVAIAVPKDKNAVSRARKRLRGEPVSPSPVKEKRARVAEKLPPQAALTFHDAPSSDEDDDMSHGDTLIMDTPAKPPIGKKQFRVLFDDAAPPASQVLPAGARTREKASLTRSKSVTAKGLFGFGFALVKENGAKGLSRTKSKALSPSPPHSDDEMDWDAPSQAAGPSAKLGAPNFSPSVPTKPSINSKLSKSTMKIPKAMIPGKDDLWSNGGPSTPNKQAESKAAPPKKRSLSPAEPSQNASTTPKAALSALPLLPPSPPQEPERKPRYMDKGKGKALARKKSQLLEGTGGGDGDESADDSSDADAHVQEVSRQWGRRTHSHGLGVDDAQGDSEPEFDIRAYRPSVPADAPAHAAREETFEVNLPDDLRRVLALAPPPHTAPDPEQEEKLVRGLLYGRREGHYDPARGGEIWGVGEVSGESEGEDGLGLGNEPARGRDEDEDDWEGEPVPWEVGEL